MYTKTKRHGLAFALAILISGLSFLSPQITNAEPTIVATDESTATVIFEGGDITLDQVASFNFGSHAIAGSTQIHPSTDDDATIQITDLRGTAEGWDLNVSLSAFTLVDGDDTLDGAYIEISGVIIDGINGTVGDAPTSDASATLEIASDGVETDILNAVTGSGSGVWAATWGETDATLIVLPGSAKAGSYSADLTWSLQSTP